MIKELEDALIALYRLEPAHSVTEFLCDLATAEQALDGKLDRREALIVAETPDGTEVGLYLSDLILESTRQRGTLWHTGRHPSDDHFYAVLEGISHFLYFMHHAEHDNPVSQLELELQAEVDKYAAPLLEGRGVGVIMERSRALRETLFQRVAFADAPDTEDGDRYRVAHQHAAAYARYLDARYVRSGNLTSLVDELRRFYRGNLRRKLEMIPR
jgi:hypothetical protein